MKWFQKERRISKEMELESLKELYKPEESFEDRMEKIKIQAQEEEDKWIKDNPRPENHWCGSEYFITGGVYKRWEPFCEHLSHLENGVEIEYCKKNKQVRKIKYKEVK